MQNHDYLTGPIISRLRDLIGLGVVNCETNTIRYIPRDELRRRIEKIHARWKSQAQKQKS